MNKYKKKKKDEDNDSIEAEDMKVLARQIVDKYKPSFVYQLCMLMGINKAAYYKYKLNKDTVIVKALAKSRYEQFGNPKTKKKKVKVSDFKDYILDIIDECMIISHNGIAAMLPISYDHYKRSGFREDPDITEAIEKTKELIKTNTRNRWEASGNATLETNAFKLIANQEELDRLTQSKTKVDHTTNGKPMIQPMIVKL